jgi:putative DNA primase/helicase
MQPERENIKLRSLGRWKGILLDLGFPMKALSGRHSPCPICDGGEDRFRFDNLEGKGSFFCSKCGAGQGVQLVMLWKRLDYLGAVRLIETVIGNTKVELPKSRMNDRDAREKMTALWLRGEPLDGRDLASRYLRSRGLEFAAYPASLRFVEELPYFEIGSTVSRTMPAMLAKIAAHDGTSALLHRTYLAEPGVKADVPAARKVMAGMFPEGGAVRLSPAEETMGIAEGIETARSCEMIHDIPVWATTTAGALVKWIPPEICKRVVIFGDLDPSFTGQQAAYALAYRLRNEKLKNPDRPRFESIEVAFTEWRDAGDIKDDWNDMRMAA